MKGQSRLGSFIESLINVLVGYGIAVVTQIVVFPWFGVHVPIKDNLIMGLVFTVISIVRSFVLRRAFNAYHLQQLARERENGRTTLQDINWG